MTTPKITIKDINDSYATWSADNGAYTDSGLHEQGAYVTRNGELFPANMYSGLREGDLSRFSNTSAWTVDTSGEVFGSNSLQPTTTNYSQILFGGSRPAVDCFTKSYVHFETSDSSASYRGVDARRVSSSDLYQAEVKQDDTSTPAKLDVHKKVGGSWTLLGNADTSFSAGETTWIMIAALGEAILGVHGVDGSGIRAASWHNDSGVSSAGQAAILSSQTSDHYFDAIEFQGPTDTIWESGDIVCTGIEYLESSLSTWSVNQDTIQYYDGLESGSFDSAWAIHDSEFSIQTHSTNSGSYSAGVYPVATVSDPAAEWDPGVQFPDVFRCYWWETSFSTGGGLYFHDKNGNFILGVATDNPQWEVQHVGGTKQIKNDDGVYGEWTKITVIFFWDVHGAWVIIESPTSGMAHYPCQMDGPLGNGLGKVYFSEYHSGSWGGGYMEMLFDDIYFNPGADAKFEAKVSTDDGATWGSWTLLNYNGAIIPQGTDLTDYRLRTRVTMQRSHPFCRPLVNSFKITLQGQLNTLSLSMTGDGDAIQDEIQPGLKSSSILAVGIKPHVLWDEGSTTSSLSTSIPRILADDTRLTAVSLSLSGDGDAIRDEVKTGTVADLAAAVVDRKDWVVVAQDVSVALNVVSALYGDWTQMHAKAQPWVQDQPQHGGWSRTAPAQGSWNRDTPEESDWTRSGPGHTNWNKE